MRTENHDSEKHKIYVFENKKINVDNWTNNSNFADNYL